MKRLSVLIVGGNECMVRQYKELRSALEQAKGKPVRTVRVHTSSMNALRGITKEHTEGSEMNGHA